MPSLNDIEINIFQVEKISVSLSIDSNLILNFSEYYKTKTSQILNVKSLKARIKKKYPQVSVIVFDGLGREAHGNFLLSNIRNTYEYKWIKEAYQAHTSIYQNLISDNKQKIQLMQKKIKELKKCIAGHTSATLDDEGDQDPYDVLGINQDASDEEVKIAYRKKVSSLHPDKIETMDESLKNFANEKMKEINTANDNIKILRDSTAQTAHSI